MSSVAISFATPPKLRERAMLHSSLTLLLNGVLPCPLLLPAAGFIPSPHLFNLDFYSSQI